MTIPVVSGLRLARRVGVGVSGVPNFHRECRGTPELDASGPSISSDGGGVPPCIVMFWSALFGRAWLRSRGLGVSNLVADHLWKPTFGVGSGVPVEGENRKTVLVPGGGVWWWRHKVVRVSGGSPKLIMGSIGGI